MARDDLDFVNLPPFPNDVPTAPLLRISLAKLLDNDESEIDRLWQACCSIGFFYLDLRAGEPSPQVRSNTISGEELYEDADQLFSLGKQFFDLPVSEKQKFDFRDQGSYFGYKGYGRGVMDGKGTKDRNEFYNAAKDYVLGIREGLPEPDLLLDKQNRQLMRDFVKRSHAVVTMLLQILEARLELPEGGFTRLHRLDAISGDQIRWVRAPPQAEDDRSRSMGEHTDFGSVTLLFNRLGGLQVRVPGSTEWTYVRPLRGHCVVNLGDALVKFSAGILKSNLHRVVNPPGKQEGETRMSLVYFSRPEDDISLRALTSSRLVAEARRAAGGAEEEDISAKDWILRKALGVRGGGDFSKAAGTETMVAVK